jgi:HK97 family phage prohead protease
VDYEERTSSLPVSVSSSGDGLTFSGYAAVFNTRARIAGQPGDFDEQIAPGAFRAVAAGQYPVLMFEHGRHPLIGSMPLGKITDAREDPQGLWIEARLTDNWLISPVRDAVADHAVEGMSFRFTVDDGGERWEDRAGDVDLRTLTSVTVPELGPVVFPAYVPTTASVRSALDTVGLPAAAAPHEPLTIVHSHAHADGHGRQHSHVHRHANDNRHSGTGHSHPGNPDDSMPTVGLASSGHGGETRGGDGMGLEDLDLGAAILAYFRQQGIDVQRSVAEAGYAREHAGQRARERAEGAQHLACALRNAKRALLFEQRGFLDHASGFGIAKVGEAQQRVDQLTAALANVCVNDPELISEAKRLAAR